MSNMLETNLDSQSEQAADGRFFILSTVVDCLDELGRLGQQSDQSRVLLAELGPQGLADFDKLSVTYARDQSKLTANDKEHLADIARLIEETHLLHDAHSLIQVEGELLVDQILARQQTTNHFSEEFYWVYWDQKEGRSWLCEIDKTGDTIIYFNRYGNIREANCRAASILDYIRLIKAVQEAGKLTKTKHATRTRSL